jgi:hypothetical protein
MLPNKKIKKNHGIKIHKLSDSVSLFTGISFVNTIFNQSGLSKFIDNQVPGSDNILHGTVAG